MKAIYCELCGTITSPGSQDRHPKSCECGTHRCWWENGGTGQFRVEYMATNPELRKVNNGAPIGRPRVWILGLHNGFLHHHSSGSPSSEDIWLLLADTPSSYIFKQTNSAIVRFRPGQSSDTAWATFDGPLPKNFAEEQRIKEAVEEALKEERRRVVNYIYTTPGCGALAMSIDALEHLKENDPT